MMSLVRLPTLLLARLLLALMLVCNLTLCISWHGTDVISSTMTTGSDNATMSATAMQGLACHTMAADDGEQGNAMSQGDCQMHGGLTSPTGAGLPLLAALLTLLALPFCCCPIWGSPAICSITGCGIPSCVAAVLIPLLAPPTSDAVGAAPLEGSSPVHGTRLTLPDTARPCLTL